jgi:hypothetical protein
MNPLKEYSTFVIPVFIILLMPIFLSFIICEQAGADEIEIIRDIYSSTNDIVNANKAKTLWFYTAEKGWIRAKDEEETDVDEIHDIFETAAVYYYDGRIIKTVITILTPSGDWVGHQEYYFYKDDNTAFIFEELRTFQGYNFDKYEDLPPGPYVIEKRIYFSKKNQIIRSLEKAFVLSSKKDVPIKYLRQLDFDLYKSVQSLPFSDIINEVR